MLMVAQIYIVVLKPIVEPSFKKNPDDFRKVIIFFYIGQNFLDEIC